MNPGQEMSEDEARLVEQLENLKVEFGEMLYELRHKLNVHIASDVIDDVSRWNDLTHTIHIRLVRENTTCISNGNVYVGQY